MGRDPEKLRAVNKRYYEANKEKLKAKIYAYRAARKEHFSAYNKARRMGRTPEQIAAERMRKREASYLRKYGITLVQYEEMLRAQGGVCALCKVPGKMGKYDKLDVDHDHETGRVRGLLCITCNHALGVLGDNSAALERALAYVKR
jgi:Recombination endonuclease VII